MKHTIGLAVALSLSVLALPSCSKEKKPEAERTVSDESKGSESEVKGAAKESAAGKASKASALPIAISAEIGGVLKHLPADTEILVSMNMAGLAGTPLWDSVGPAAMAKAGDGVLGKANKACGFDPIASLKSIHFAMNSNRDDEPVLIVNGLSRGPTLKCVKTISDMEKAGMVITEDGNFTTIKGNKKDETQLLLWLDESTLLLVPGKSDKAYLQARFDGKDSLTGNADFMASVAKANLKSPIWFAGNFGASSVAAQNMSMIGGRPQSLYGSVAFVNGIQLALGVAFSDEAAAKTTSEKAKSMLDMFKGNMGKMAGLADKVQFSTEGRDLKVSLDMNAQEVKQLSNMASMFTQK